ncbi:AcrR family transcriptional regulator [Crossiella equi]|uniref:AcrR family transcriptional regulator n=1 Tax=Crossiella equi TaxID=130796 RepID=A0ABS5A3Z8_9PSEU|nr:TetR/AcrR family transcriptional regulator [Crossiella equi]MBP2471303.1 AcrR family transcriptional regulator [Crossiella equi]
MDADEQKALIAGAMWRLADRGGLERISMREVAAEAGVSTGRVQHYFRSKDELLRHGLALASQRMEARIAARLTGGSAEELLRAAIDEVLGDDPDTRQTIRVNVAFLGRALVDEHIAQLLFQDNAELRALATEVIHTARPDCPVPEREARILWLLVDALGVELACGQLSGEQARETMRHHLDRVLGR